MSKESIEHKKLKNDIKFIMENFHFKTYREVHFNFSGNKRGDMYTDEASIDVLVEISYNNTTKLLLFECKDKKKPITRGDKTKIEDLKDKLLSKKDNCYVLSNKDGFKRSFLKEITDIKYCFVFSKKLEKHNINLSKEKYWDYDILKYFKKVSPILGEWGKFEIFREFDLKFDKNENLEIRLDAIKIKQPGSNEMYLTAMEPARLLQISYVVRRASNVSEAYQRLLNKDRVEKLSKFISTKKVLLPNAIIIVFDQNIENDINYDSKDRKLIFPLEYCSAWIIDGQHRVFSFIKTIYKELSEKNKGNFELPVVIFKNLDITSQSKLFVDINYNQKKIDPTLLCDLTTVIKDMKNELTWPSLLGYSLNKDENSPLKGLIKISELDEGKPINLTSFIKYGLLETLLGFKTKSKEYKGRLYEFAPFYTNKKFNSEDNQIAFQKQLNLLKRYFTAIKDNFGSTWEDTKKCAILKPTGINALFLVLAKIMEVNKNVEIDLKEYLKPIKEINFERENVKNMGGGWVGFRTLANEIIKKLNAKNPNEPLTLFGEKEKL